MLLFIYEHYLLLYQIISPFNLKPFRNAHDLSKYSHSYLHIIDFFFDINLGQHIWFDSVF